MNNKQSGNIFAVLFGAVALIGVLAATSMQMITGPLKTMTAVTQKNLVQSQLLTNARLVVIHAGIQVNNGDADSDGFIEPVEYIPNGTSGCNISLVGGGCLPVTLGASLTDPFGRLYGYCVWDHGAVDGGHADGAAAAPYRLNGDTDPTHPVIALISGGRDQTFQTSCLAYDGAGTDGVNRVVGSDDLVFTYTYAEATAASGGLWSIKPADADTAEIAKDLEVKDSSNNVTVAIDRATGIGDFLGITTDVITAKTGNDLFIEGLTEIEIATDDGDILSLRNQDAPLFVFNSAYNSNHRLPIFEMLGSNNIGGTRGVAGIIEGNTPNTQWQTTDAILQFNARRGGTASTVGNLFNWMNNDSPVMTLSHEGNLGIGTNSPTDSLEVAGTASIQAPGVTTSESYALKVGQTVNSGGEAGNKHYGIKIEQLGARYDLNYGLFSEVLGTSGFYGGETLDGLNGVRGVGAYGYSPVSTQAYQKGIGLYGKASTSSWNYNSAIGVRGLAEAASDNFITSSSILQAGYGGHFVAHGKANSIGIYADAYLDASPGAGQEALPLLLATNGNELLRVSSGGRMGFGTTLPDEKLDIKSASAPSISLGLAPQNIVDNQEIGSLKFTGMDGGYSVGAEIRGVGDGTWTGPNDADTRLEFYVNEHASGPKQAMTIKQDGKIGIGTNDPQASLDTDSIHVGRTPGNATEALKISVDDNRARFESIQDENGGTNGGFQFDLGGFTGTTGAFVISQQSNFGSVPSNSLFIVGADGNVGLSTVSPRATLDVNGFVRLARFSSEPKACSGADDGAIALTSGARMCVCDDPNGWVEISDRTPCSW